MAVDLDTSRKYYSLRSGALESGEFYTTIKNQTFQQNSYFTFTAPRQVISAVKESGTSLEFNCKFFISVAVGALTLMANETGSWSGIQLNGTGSVPSSSNPWEIEHDDYTTLTFVEGYNTITGTFTLSSGTEDISVTGFWENGWEA